MANRFHFKDTGTRKPWSTVSISSAGSILHPLKDGPSVSDCVTISAANGKYAYLGTHNGKKTFIHIDTSNYYMWYNGSSRWYISTSIGSTPGSDWIGSATTSASSPWDVSWSPTVVEEGADKDKAHYVITDISAQAQTDLTLDNGEGGSKILVYMPAGSTHFKAPIAVPAISGVSSSAASVMINYYIQDNNRSL
jgi:hypothetical protein